MSITTMRFNITLPKEIGLKLKRSSNYSQVIAEALQEQFKRQEQAQLEADLIEGYKARAEENLAMAKEWENTLADGLDDESY